MLSLSFEFSCNKNSKDKDIPLESDSIILLKEAFKYSSTNHNLPEMYKTKIASKYRVYIPEEKLFQVVNEIKGDSIAFLQKDELCSLSLTDLFILVKDLQVNKNEAELHIYTQCVYPRQDTCIIGGMCGGGIMFRFKKAKNHWKISKAITFSD